MMLSQREIDDAKEDYARGMYFISWHAFTKKNQMIADAIEDFIKLLERDER